MATGPRSTLGNKLAQMMTAIEEVVYRVANMTTNKHAEIQVLQCEDQTQATNWSMADENCVVNRPG